MSMSMGEGAEAGVVMGPLSVPSWETSSRLWFVSRFSVVSLSEGVRLVVELKGKSGKKNPEQMLATQK